MLGNPTTVYSVTSLPKPAYLVPFVDPIFGTQVMRIANNPGASTSPVSGSWGSDARHVYSKQQPWNSTQALMSVENRSGGSPSPLILDGATYAPRYAPCGNYSLYDYRWHPSQSHPNEQINVTSAGTELMWFDVTTCTKTRSWTLPLTADYGIGSGEGNPSEDGRFVVVGNNSAIVVVDMDPQPPYAAYPNKRIGPVYTFPPCSLLTGSPTSCTIGNVSISPSGRYVDVKYSGGSDTTADMHRIYEVDPATLAIKPHNMASSSQRCGSFAKRPNGWIFPLKHADMARNPFDSNEDVIIGGRACPGSSLGRVVMVRLRDGQVSALTDPTNEPSVQHVSTRSIRRPGWAYVGYYKADGKKFNDEIVAVKMDGSQAVERITQKHSATSGCYRCESHPVPSPDGQRVVFASNWAQDCSSCGSTSDIKDYVAWSSGSVGVEDSPAPSPGTGSELALESIRPNPAGATIEVAYALDRTGSAALELVDVSGRRVLQRDLGLVSPGRHESRMSRPADLPAGVYWLRLTQAGRHVTRRMVLLP